MSPEDDVIHHRLTALERLLPGVRQVERDVDHLKIDLARLEGLLKEWHAETKANEEHTRGSLARLHKRLDEVKAAELVESGAQQERARMGQRMIMAVTLGTAVGGVFVGLVTLILNQF